MSNRVIAVLIFAVAVVGCASNVPPQKPITDGIFQAPMHKSALSSVEGGRNKSVVVLISENTKANVDYLKGKQEEKKGLVLRAIGVNSTLDAYAEVLDPNYSLTWIAKKLKNKFGTVNLITSLNGQSNRNYDYLVIVDATFITTGWGSDEATASITTQFYDSMNQHITDAKGYRKQRVRWGASGPHGVELFKANHAVRVAALEEWERSVDHLVQGAN